MEPVFSPPAFLFMQTLGEAASDGSGTRLPVTGAGILQGALGSWLQCGPAKAGAGIWERTSGWKTSPSVSLLLFQINIFKNRTVIH